MEYIILIIVGVAGMVLGTYFGRRRASNTSLNQSARLPASGGNRSIRSEGEKEWLIEKQAREKEENKQRILEVLETQTPLTNNQIEQSLGVSDATATRYLDELEKEGKVRQVGKTGKHVYYEKS